MVPLCFTARVSRLQPKDTYTAREPLCAPCCKKGSSAFRPNSLSYNEVAVALSMIAVSATIAAANIGQHVVRRGKRAVVAVTKGIFEAVGLAGVASG